MDLESECSALESVEDNELIATNEKLDSVIDSGNKVEINGSCAVLHDKQLDDDGNGKAVEITELVNSPPTLVRNGSGSPSPDTAVKGFGLRKWRRIKRDVINDGVGNVDSSKLLKRGLSNGVAQSGKPMQVSSDMKQKSEGSVSSTNAIGKGRGVVFDGFAMGDHGPLGSVMGPVFAAGRTDSENSDDQSSKSSTAASVPKTRYEGPVGVGHARDKYKMGSLSGKNLGSSVQRVQQGKVRIETSKKPKGERVEIEKENSHSSMESDSRSSNFVFMQGNYSLTSNGRQNGRSLNHDEVNSAEPQGVEREVSEKLEAGYGRKINGDFGDDSQGNLLQGCSTDQDSLIESIQLFQSVQVELEREVAKFRDIGKEDIGVDESSQDSCLPSELVSIGLEIQDRSSSEQLHSGVALESEIIILKENVHSLESKLNEVTAMLKVKETKVVELEAIFNSLPLKEETSSAMESKLESLFRQKIEAEVEFLAISRTIHNVEHSVLEEQREVASEKSRVLEKLGDAETKTVKLKREAKELEIVDETLKLQSSVCKYSSCFFIQLILLAVLVGLYVSQLSPPSAGLVPT